MFSLGRYLLSTFQAKQALYNNFAQSLDEKSKIEFEEKIQIVSQRLLDIQGSCSSWNPFVRLYGFWKAWNIWNQYIELDDMTKAHWWQCSLWSQSWFSLGTVLIFIFLVRHLIFGLYCTPTGSAEPNILVGDRILGLKYVYYFQPIARGDLVIFNQPSFVYDQESRINRFWQRYVGIALPIFGLPNGPDAWVKRVIALPGDLVEGKIENGKSVVYLNGQKLDQSFTNPYPLITIKREIGFVPESWGWPSMLTKTVAGRYGDIRVTYDPSKPYEQQQFYKFTEEELVLGQDQNPILSWPETPSRNDVFGPMRVPVGKLWCMGDNRKNSDDCRSWGFLDKSLVIGRASRILFSVDSHEPWWIFDLIKHPINFFTKHLRYSRFGRSLHPFYKVYET